MPSRRYQDHVEAVAVVTLPAARHAGAESGETQFQQKSDFQLAPAIPAASLLSTSQPEGFSEQPGRWQVLLRLR